MAHNHRPVASPEQFYSRHGPSLASEHRWGPFLRAAGFAGPGRIAVFAPCQSATTSQRPLALAVMRLDLHVASTRSRSLHYVQPLRGVFFPGTSDHSYEATVC